MKMTPLFLLWFVFIIAGTLLLLWLVPSKHDEQRPRAIASGTAKPRVLTIPNLDVTCVPTLNSDPLTGATFDERYEKKLHEFIVATEPPHDAIEWVPVTPEMQCVLDDDPVQQFCKRVRDTAQAKPYWHDNYARALYDAFSEESGKQAVDLLKQHGLIDR